jgi:hypothetical protein
MDKKPLTGVLYKTKKTLPEARGMDKKKPLTEVLYKTKKRCLRQEVWTKKTVD